jgi:hypothetical protein
MFRIGQSDKHGLGWIASVNIACDTPISDEKVSIRFPMNVTNSSASELDEAIAQLPSDDRDAFLDLHGKDPMEKLLLNCVRLMDSKNDPFGIGPRNDIGVYFQCARLNHSCLPNAVRASDANIMSVVAQKDITAGEEITISYLDDNFLTAVERHKQMRGKMRVGHTWESCQCELCTSPEHMRLASDQRRRILFSMRAQLLNGKLGLHSLRNEFFPLMAKEGLLTTLMGVPASMKMMELLGFDNVAGSTTDELNALSYVPGVKVILHKLRTKPELNGQTGTVVSGLSLETGRVGVLLDQAAKPIAVKPENVCWMRK